jgi:uncharacterized membrane protein
MKTLVAFIVSLFLLVSSAAALTVSDVTLGSDDQERGLTTSATFTVTNNGNTSLTGLAITSNALALYNVTFSGLPANLSAGASATVTVTGKVPLDFDAVDDDLTDEAFKIADLTVTADGGASASSALKMQAENQIQLKSIHAEVADDIESLDDGDKLDVKPGEEVTLTIKVKNLFSDSDDVDIDDIEVRVYSDDSDMDVDEDDEVDVAEADSEELTLTFEVDEDADDGTYDLFITADGTDDNGARHGDKVQVKLKVDRESHEVEIESASLSTSRVKACPGTNTVTLNVGIRNIGKRDEEDAAVEVTSDALDIEQRREDIELDRDDDARFKFLLEVPHGTPTGTYGIEVAAFHSDDTLTDSRTLSLDVTQCETPPAVVPPPSTGTQPAPAPQAPPAAAPPASPGTGAATGSDSPSRLKAFAESDTYLAMLAGLIAVVALAIILLIVAFARRR